MSDTLAELPAFLHDLFCVYPDELNAELGFCQRRRALTPSSFVRALVFGWLADPDATPDDLANYASTLGPPLSGSALRQQLLKTTAPVLLRAVLDAALQPLWEGTPCLLPVLQRFNGVHVIDTSILSLPRGLARRYPGTGNQHGVCSAGCKVLFDLEITCGGLVQLEFFSARDPDQGLFAQCQPLPDGALALRDLGFFAAVSYTEQSQQGVFWLTRAQPQLVVQRDQQTTQTLMAFLRDRGETVDLPAVEVGTKHRLHSRLIAWRVPDAVAARRRQKRQEQQSRRQRRRVKARRRRHQAGPLRRRPKRVVKPVTAEQLEWCEWVVVLTNVPAEQLSVREAQALLRARWQIEVLIKVWKQSGRLEGLRGQRAERVECEILAKLLGQVVTHWALLSSGRVYLSLRVVSACKQVRLYAERLGQTLAQTLETFGAVWGELRLRLRRVGRRRRGRKRPSTEQRLAGLDQPWEAIDAA